MPSFELLKRRMGDRIRIVCWADCGGMGVELFALEMMATRVKEHLGVSVEIVPYAFCDTSKPAQKFAALNHKPRHIITDMMERDFEAGTSHCHTCDADHDIPPSGVDLYVCCFPCGPWSTRGKQLRFDDADGDKCGQALKSIKYMKPCLFALTKTSTDSDLQHIVRAMIRSWVASI